MFLNPQGQGYLGTSYPVPVDPSYYLSQVGLSSLTPQAFNSNSLSAMFSQQGMTQTPVNAQASNPFEQLFMKSSADATKLQRKQVPGMEMTGQPGQEQQGGGY